MSKLVTFGDGSVGIRSAAKRLCNQAITSGYFMDPPEHWDLNEIDKVLPHFLSENQDFLKTHRKGLGLWLWQPALLIAALSNSAEDQVICFLDAGCQLSPDHSAQSVMAKYIEFVNRNDFLFIQIREKSFGIEDLSEIAWTKSDCLNQFNLDLESLESPQIQSGIILVRNCERVREFAFRWYENCRMMNYQLLVDSSDKSAESPRFISHRYSQSILSLMVKSEGLPRITDETYWFPDWSEGLDHPIWSMRNRSGGDAYRRNIFDLLKIAGAKIERELIARFK
jgi:hypothetical protein